MSFSGTADSESAFKEGEDIEAAHCFFNLRYPFWHDHGLTITDSEMTELIDTDLAFEKFEVEEVITTKVDSIKNPLCGWIQVPEVGEVIMDDEKAKGEILIGGQKRDSCKICSCA